jgi:hypothetical protein
MPMGLCHHFKASTLLKYGNLFSASFESEGNVECVVRSTFSEALVTLEGGLLGALDRESAAGISAFRDDPAQARHL